MKKVLLGLLPLLGITFSISSAEAARYLVIVKDQKAFSQMQSLWTLGANQQMSVMLSGSVSASASQPQFVVQNSLAKLNAMVVESADDHLDSKLLKQLGNQEVYVEKEIFHPAPKPIRGYHLTRAWDFSASQVSRKASPAMFAEASPAKPLDNSAESQIALGAGGMPWGIAAVHAPEAWNLSHKGQGARVLVLDTGIDRDHPALRANFEAGKNFVGDDNYPYEYADHEGHGTHVSGTIAGAELGDGFSGVAPQARLLMGRVCSTEGCSNIAVASGIDWGIEEKVDVLNMSLGGDVGTKAEKMAVERAEAAGVTVVAASGNGGKDSVGYPAAYPTVMAVGAVDSKLVKADFSQWGPQLAIMGPGADVRSSVPVGTGRASTVFVGVDGQLQQVPSAAFGAAGKMDAQEKPLAEAGLGKPEDFQGKDLTGKFALISRGEIHFSEKVKNAIAAHAEGVVLYNNTVGVVGGEATEDGTEVNIPVVMIEQEVGLQLAHALKAGQALAASVSVAATDYENFDGTSMATPHVTGVAALVKATNPQLTPAQVREVLKATAQPLGPNTQNEYGAGLVNAAGAVAQAAQMR